MLVLSRKVGEAICLHDDTVVTILAVRGDPVRVGIQAPGHILVDRQEVWIRKQQPSAATNTPASGEMPPCP